MCGRYYIDDGTLEIKKIILEMNKKWDSPGIKMGEICPTNEAIILIAKGGMMEPVISKWGFPNFKGSGVIINARSETVFEKKLFRDSLVSRRCIIPASGFYEWNANKEKIYFTPQEETTMYMSGIFNVFNNEIRFVILTTGANSSISDVHNRMPLLLSDSQLEEWLFNDTQTQKILKQAPYMLNRKCDFIQQTLDLF
ncbi:MAG TPA: SOS response-associated peptidase [Clostridiales bacterium]|nr:SOS response-associated peptidase [Clostridiales bacterium]